MSDSRRLLDRFVGLCEIPSPTGDERAVADAVAAELRDLGVDFAEDGPAGPARANAGNLIARIPGRGDGWVMFCAHLDTVPHDAPVEVDLSDGVYRSRGETILGADNKAAVTVLVELAARHAPSPPPVGLELVFTVAEEDGLRGAKALDLDSLRSPYGFVLDHASPIGEIVVAAPTYERLAARLRGRRGPRGDPARGRPQRDRCGGGRDRGDEARTPRRGDDGQRRHDRGRDRDQRRAGGCEIEAEARSLDPARASEAIALDDRRLHLGGGRTRLRPRRSTSSRCSAATGSRRTRSRSRSRRARSSAAATSRARSRRAAAATPTR